MENFTENVLLQVVKKHSFSKSISMNLNFLLLPTSTINSPPPPQKNQTPKNQTHSCQVCMILLWMLVT